MSSGTAVGPLYETAETRDHGRHAARWFHQTAVECRDIYALAPPGCELGRDFINAASPRVERQILRAGYRLAKVLNDLFG